MLYERMGCPKGRKRRRTEGDIYILGKGERRRHVRTGVYLIQGGRVRGVCTSVRRVSIQESETWCGWFRSFVRDATKQRAWRCGSMHHAWTTHSTYLVC